MTSFASLLSLLLVVCGAQGGRRPCKLGLAVNVSVNGGAKELVDSILEERRLGCNLMASSAKWGDLEVSPDTFRLNKLRADLFGAIQAGFTPVLTLQTIDTNNKTVPVDLMSEPWDSPKMLRRERLFLQALVDVLPSQIGAVMLGNEVDAYLALHGDEIGPYLKFLQNGREVLKAARPGIQVGVTTEFSALSKQGEMISLLHRGMDIVSMTYYPLTSDFSVQPVGGVGSQFDQMLAVSGDQRLYIQEAGYPASSLLSSSDAKQARFVDAVFDAMAKHGDKLFGVCFFLLVDFNDKFVDGLVRYYGLHTDRFRAMLSTLGFKKQDGTPRPAWDEFKKRASAF